MTDFEMPEKYLPMGESGQMLNPKRVEVIYNLIKEELVYGEIITLVLNLIPEISDEELMNILNKKWGKK